MNKKLNNQMEHIILDSGVEYWWNRNRFFHSENGGPSYIDTNGSESWCKNNQNHRENNPAYISVNGKENWYKNGKILEC